uniref:Thylakoid lumen protein n=1 Tax=Tetraselmis sp. GSL018 TaxID=582737 RepID=A0A061REQ3_9CHLO|mmetsp:Transcript_42703/g.101386  ORF Transcript_42703/g.101386 Transcript_42703/m.101386 type:complete len:259 (-) Transcript_42703:191-967(-)
MRSVSVLAAHGVSLKVASVRKLSVSQGSGQIKCSLRKTSDSGAESRQIYSNSSVTASFDRRFLLSSLVGVSLSPCLTSNSASAADLVLFKGTASPPTSYGGYGGNAEEEYKYQFLVPGDWKSAVINKVDKGTKGIDCRFSNPNIKGMKAFVISLGRAGEDRKSFVISDAESTFQGFAGADYDLQDSLSTADDTSSSTREDGEGNVYYEYDINSPIIHYKASIATKQGKIFALFVSVPGQYYEEQKPLMEEMISSFKTI